ncbi:MAG TPA: NADPH-dependent assimilatory sulfite reductase hemoprotein subunit [Gemmatimonadales bacterium]
MTDGDTPRQQLADESRVETAKRLGRYLRGTIAETLASDASHFGADDVQLLKFHGIYQQDDRDRRKPRRALGLDKAHQFMIRVALPAGRLTAAQYVALDRLADATADKSLRITTRQGLQYHGVVKGDLKTTIASVNEQLVTTLAACGDVERNVMACPAPLADPSHAAVKDIAARIAADLRPATSAYHEIWLDGERVRTTAPGRAEEPLYSERYLPRKFKTAVAAAEDNCVDVYAQDVGLVAHTHDGRVSHMTVLVGGGLGMTHGKGDTLARLAEPLADVAVDDAATAVRTIAAIFRDHGNRADRRHARLKYLLAEWGSERFGREFRRRIGRPTAPPSPLPAPVYHDHLGPHRQPDGRWFCGVFVQSGRVADRGSRRLRSALRGIVEDMEPGIAFTPQQNVLFTDLTGEQLTRLDAILRAHGVAPVQDVPAVRRHAMACPALPTCGLAVAESERFLPSVLDRLEAELDTLGLDAVPFTVRMTGCPNGCARPYTADLAFVGRSLDLYHIYVGGRLAGDRMTDLYRADVTGADLVDAVRPLLARWAEERLPDEGLGDWYQRSLGSQSARRMLTGKELPVVEAPLFRNP